MTRFRLHDGPAAAARGSQYLPEDQFESAQVIRWLIYEQTDVVPMIGGLRFRLLVGRLRPSDAEALRRRAGRAAMIFLPCDSLFPNDKDISSPLNLA